MEPGNTNQPINAPDLPQQPIPNPVTKKKNPFMLTFGVLALLLVVGGGAYYFGTQTSSTQESDTLSPSPTASQENTQSSDMTTSPSPLPTSSLIEENDWETYEGTDYSMKYPSEWELTGPSEYMETVQLINPKKTVSVTISKGQYPYGFSGPNNAATKDISISINGQTIETVEYTTENGTYVDFAIGEYHILYGTDYPAVGTQASLSDYNDSKEIIAKILSTFTLGQ